MRIRTQPPDTATPGTRLRCTICGRRTLVLDHCCERCDTFVRVKTTSRDCLALGCDWAWGAEPCPCGQPHTFRICGRCLVSDDPVCHADTSDAPDTDDDRMWAEVAA